ncbi:MAG: TIGR03960 family B12-binding radical SAM protein [Polyangiales bacterium]
MSSTTATEHPYAPFLRDVKKPAQYVGGEQGEKTKPWDSVSARMCLAFPDLYEIGMSHLGYKILYGILNAHPKLLAERAYAPWVDMEAKLREHDVSLRSLESARPLRDFDVVGFSLQFELTYTNVLTMLDLGGIAPLAADRDDDAPLVIAGGPVATHAEPLSDFVDAFLIGDGEEKLPELLLTWAALRDAGMPRAQRLVEVAKLGGWYVPSLYERAIDPETGFLVVTGPKHPDAPYPVERAIVRDLAKFPSRSTVPSPPPRPSSIASSVEIARGCTEGCRFCQAGMIYRPVRERPPEQVLETLQKAVREGGYDEASLTSLSTADYSAIQPLVHEVTKSLSSERVSVSVSSLRAYGLSEQVLDDMKSQRAGGLTFAPEAGTQRMRDVVNKNVTEEQLMTTAERIFSRGWSKMKLYFMIGLPTEEDEDVVGIVQTGARALQVGRNVRGRRKDTRVTVSVSTHVPKPHTPFQWCAMDAYEEVVRKQRLLRDEVRRTGVQLRMHDSKGSWLEGVLARGDARLAPVLYDAWKNGARFDSWDEQVRLDVWREAFEKAALDPQLWLGTIPVTARLPWDHLDVGLEEGFLAKEYRKALANRLSPPCGKVAGTFVHHTNLEDAEADRRKLVCYDCGIACDMGKMRGDRLTHLDTLNAHKPRLAVIRDEAEVAHDIDRRPMRDTQGEPLRLRIGFEKVGKMAYVGHLDLVRLFPRWFRRAELPLWYSEGFHPKPQMTFGPALALGIASLGEHVDIKVRKDAFDPSVLDERLAALAFEGAKVLGVKVLGPQDSGINKIVDVADWVMGVPRSTLAELGLADAEALEAFVRTRLEGKLEVMRDVKGIGKKVDVGAYLRDVVVGEGSEELARAGLVGELVPLRFSTNLVQGGSARPSEVVQALLGRELPVRLVRVGLFALRDGERIDPLELERLRPLRVAAEPVEADAVAE